MATTPRPIRVRFPSGTDERVTVDLPAAGGYILSRRYANVSGSIADASFRGFERVGGANNSIEEIFHDPVSDTDVFPVDGRYGHATEPVIPHGSGQYTDLDGVTSKGSRRRLPSQIEFRMESTVAASYDMQIMWAQEL